MKRTGRGEKDVEIFVAVLAHSRLIYAEAVPDQRVRHWTMAHRRALEYFGGVPERWIIDNLKAGVHKPDREAPQLNASFREFAQHYNVAVLPARPRQATDKGLVEASVGAVQTRILLELRHQTFFSLDAMNAAIRRELHRLNNAPMASGESRRALFEANERASLQPLPRNPWDWGEWVPRKVGPNGHPVLLYSGAGRVSRPAAERFANLRKTEPRAREHGLHSRQLAAPRSGAQVAAAPLVILKPVRDDAPDHLGSGGMLRFFGAQPVQCLDHGPWKADHDTIRVPRGSAH